MPKRNETPPAQHGGLAVKPNHGAADNSTDFWGSPTLDALAARQNVGPIGDATVLLGGWPGDVNDGFEDAIRKLRGESVIGTRS